MELTSLVKLELTNLDNGSEIEVLANPLSLSFMPNDFRRVPIRLPNNIPPGKYSALAIVDIGSNHDVEVAILDFEL